MSIKIEEGKFYRRRDGKQSGRIERNIGAKDWVAIFPWYDPLHRAGLSDVGTYLCTGERHPYDLVAEWVDEPAAPSASAKSLAEHIQARLDGPAAEQPDIKVGQRWTWLEKMASDLFTKGKSYEIMSVGAGSLTIEDDKGRSSNDGRGHYWPIELFPRYFALASSTPEQPDIKAEIADEAKRIVSGARRSAYGKPEQNFERIARFWQAYFENTGRGAVNITAADVSPMMRLMKEARLCETPDHRDSFVDLVGYTLTGAEVNGVKPA